MWCKLYHLLTLDEFNDIYKDNVKWTCDSCKSLDVTFSIDQETKILNSTIRQELETQNEKIKTINKDLNQANKEIRELKSQMLLLETLVEKKRKP